MEMMSEAMREAYRDTVANLTYIRSQRWIVTNYTLAGYGAVVALSKFGGRDLPLYKREFLTGIVGLIALLGLTILTSYTLRHFIDAQEAALRASHLLHRRRAQRLRARRGQHQLLARSGSDHRVLWRDDRGFHSGLRRAAARDQPDLKRT